MAPIVPERASVPPPAAHPRAGWRARGHLLIVNVRGFQRADPLYRELAALGWKTTVLDVEEPTFLRWYARARSFRPGVARWRRRWERVAERLARTPLAFKSKSRAYGRLIEKSGAPYDLILQGGAMFAPGWPVPAKPYAILCDCTVKLGEGEARSGVDFASPTSAARWYALEGMLYRNAACVFSASQYVSRSLFQDYAVDPGRVVTVGEGCRLQAPAGSPRSYDGKTILYVGYEFQRKGGEVLLAAFEKVVAEVPDAELLIAGPRRVAAPLSRGVTWLGPLSASELSRLYARASLFVMPSLFEPFGQVFLEAMEHGLPCVGSDRCAMPEIIVDGETGLIAPAGDAEALAQKITYLLRRPHTMRRMGERGRQRVRTFFTWPAVAARIDARLVELIAVGAPRIR